MKVLFPTFLEVGSRNCSLELGPSYLSYLYTLSSLLFADASRTRLQVCPQVQLLRQGVRQYACPHHAPPHAQAYARV